MQKYVVYNPETGKILRTGHCPPGYVEKQARPGEAVLEGSADDELHFIQDGRVVPLDQNLNNGAV